jgi:hypothetical protein
VLFSKAKIVPKQHPAATIPARIPLRLPAAIPASSESMPSMEVEMIRKALSIGTPIR